MIFSDNFRSLYRCDYLSLQHFSATRSTVSVMGRLKKRKRLSQQFAATARSKLRMLRSDEVITSAVSTTKEAIAVEPLGNSNVNESFEENSAEQTLVLRNSSQINEVEEILLQSDEAGTIPLFEESLQSNEAQQNPVLEESSIEADVLPGNDI